MLRKCYTYYESNALSRDEVDFFMNESLSCCLLSVCSCYLIGGKKLTCSTFISRGLSNIKITVYLKHKKNTIA